MSIIPTHRNPKEVARMFAKARGTTSDDLAWQRLHLPSDFTLDRAVDLLERIATDASLGSVLFETVADATGLAHLVGVARSASEIIRRLVHSLAPGIRLTPDETPRLAPAFVGRILVADADGMPPGDPERAARALRGALETAEADRIALRIQLDRRILINLSEGVQGVRSPQPGFRVEVRVGVDAADGDAARDAVGGILASVRLAYPAGRVRLAAESPRLYAGVPQRPGGLTVPAAAVAPLLAWPSGDRTNAHRSSRPLVPAKPLASTARTFATTNAPGMHSPVGIPAADSLTHTLLIGPNGVGKSSAMVNLMLADAEAGGGMLCIDPKSDTARTFMERLPTSRRRDVVVVDPADPTGLIVGFNPLAGTRYDPWLQADLLLGCLRMVWQDSWGPRSEEVIGAALITLAQTSGATLLWLPRLLTDDAFRAQVLAGIDDPLGVGLFWDRYATMKDPVRATLIGPTMTKLQELFSRPPLRTMLGQAEPHFGLEQIFDENKIVLVDLNKGRLGSSVARLLGSLIIGTFWPLVLGRADVPAAQRGTTNVYIDEVQDFLALPGDLADALSQARGLGVGFTVAHQYRAQLSEDMRAAFDANLRSKIYFTLDAADATEAARRAPELDAADFMALPKFHIYANVMQDGQASGWLSATTLEPPPPLRDAEEIRALSRARHGVAAREVEANVLRSLGLSHLRSVSTRGGAIA